MCPPTLPPLGICPYLQNLGPILRKIPQNPSSLIPGEDTMICLQHINVLDGQMFTIYHIAKFKSLWKLSPRDLKWELWFRVSSAEGSHCHDSTCVGAGSWHLGFLLGLSNTEVRLNFKVGVWSHSKTMKVAGSGEVSVIWCKLYFGCTVLVKHGHRIIYS